MLCITINAHTKIAVNVWADFDKLNLNWFWIRKLILTKVQKFALSARENSLLRIFKRTAILLMDLLVDVKNVFLIKI